MLSLLFRLALASPWDAPPWTPPPPPVGWEATEATWRLRIREGEPVEVEATYRFVTPAPAMANVRFVDADLLVTYASGPVIATPAGLVLALEPGPLAHEERVRGLYAVRADGRMIMDIHPAARTRVEVDAPGLDVTVEGAVGGELGPASQLQVSWVPHRDEAPPVRQALVNGEVATAFRAEAGTIALDSALRWTVLRGEVDTFRFEAAGLQEIDVAGTNIERWSASGATVTIKTKSPVKGVFTARVSGRASPKGEAAVPGPVPTGVARVDRFWTLGKADEGELIPVSTPSSITEKQLPAWARGLGEGAPLAHWRGHQPLRVLPVAFDAVQGPDTVVTSARYVVSAAREGRIALRQVYRVRNERRQYLHVRAAPGWKPIVVRVGGLPVSALDDGQGGLYIPLEKSVETLRGLLAFPVDVEWIGEDDVWTRKGDHQFRLPSVDAPVQSASWEVHLPRGYRAVGRDGRSFVATVDTTADRRTREVVDSAVLKAASAYKENDFDTAQRWLDEAKNYEVDNEDVAQLQDNLDVLSGKAAPTTTSSSSSAAYRRVKELAKAKTGGLQEKQVVVEQEAETLLRSGDYDKAEALWNEALAIANELERTEQVESTVQKSNIAEAEEKLASIRAQKKAPETPQEPPPDEAYALFSRLGGTSGGSATERQTLESLGYIDANTGSDVAYGAGGLGVVGTGEGGGGQGYGWGSSGDDSGSEDGSYDRDGRDEGTFHADEDQPADIPEELGKDYLARVPEGRSYQSVVATVPGAVAENKPMGGLFGKKEAKADKSAEAPPARADVSTKAVAGPQAGATVGGRSSGSATGAVASQTVVAHGAAAPAAVAPPPPPAPPRTAAPAPKPSLSFANEMIVSREEPASEDFEVAEEEIAGERAQAVMAPMAPPLVEPVATPDPAPVAQVTVKRVPERRKALEASASPMAVAMCLDSPAITHSSALLPSGAFPTFTVKYKELPGENL